MLFYTFLFLASLAVSLLILWVYSLTVRVGKKRQRVKKKLRNQAGKTSQVSGYTYGKNVRMAARSPAHNASTNDPLMTTWTGSIQSRDEYRPRAFATQGSTLSAYLARKYSEKQSSADWKQQNNRPLRDDRSYLAKPAYRSASTTHIQKANGSVVPKPWGW